MRTTNRSAIRAGAGSRARNCLPVIGSRVFILLLFLTGTVASADEAFPRMALTFSTELATDSDGFRAIRVRSGALEPYVNAWRSSGVAAQSTIYASGNYRREVSAIIGAYRDQRRSTLAGVDIEAGLARVAGRLRPIGDATLRLSTTLGTAMDLMVSADLVETPKALDRGIGYTLVALGAEHAFTDRFTVTGFAGWQRFSDRNVRDHLRARLIWLVSAEHGITAQLRYRQFHTHTADVGQAYFNPGEYRQWLAVAAIRRRYQGWILSGALGVGQERSTGVDVHPSYLVELRAEGVVTRDIRLIAYAGYNRSAGFVDNPDYSYRRIGATLVVPLH